MAFTTKKLAFLRLSNVNSDIYDPPASTKGLVHNITIHNSSGSSQTVIINYHDGSNEWPIYNMTLLTLETVQLSYQNEGLVVDAAAKLTGSSTDANVTVVQVSGSEET